MKYIEKNGIKILSYLENEKIICGVSTRIGGYSEGTYASLNVGINTNDDTNTVSKNINALFSTFAPDFTVFQQTQIHSKIIHTVDRKSKPPLEGDGFISSDKNLLLTATIADCGSVCFHNSDFSTIAILHSGWRGTQQGIIENMCSQLSALAPLSDFTAYIGPMILCESYEVGAEFCNYFPKQYFHYKNNKIYFDLNSCIHDKLQNTGIGTIVNSNIDTFRNDDLFFSHRKNNASGRMCAFIGLKP